MDIPYVIFELANAHGGSKERMLETIACIHNISYEKKGIKLQIFKPDQIALADFSWYETYLELYQEKNDWKEIIAEASSQAEIWIDVFDKYGLEVIGENQRHIHGLKLQASVLDNVELLNEMKQMRMEDLALIINISGIELSRIFYYIEQFNAFSPKEIILQIGFQSYPTSVSDTALHKIRILKEAFPSFSICLADHAEGESAFAKRAPILGVVAGCSYIEKHFCLNRSESKYDFQSSLEPSEMEELLSDLMQAKEAFGEAFINKSEATYLEKTYQAPVTSKPLSVGSLVSKEDVLFRRTDQTGLTLEEIERKQKDRYVLSENVSKYKVIKESDFKSSNVGVIVACRMKSSRLKQKALQKLSGVASIERCLENCLRFENINKVVLATSTVEEDAVLAEHLLEGKVEFWRGDPDDVILRYLGACDKYGIDVIVRVTADCPVVSPEITKILLEKHFSSGADYTACKNCAVGSAAEVYNTAALRKVVECLGKADYSEYMTWYLRNNPHIFKLNIVDLPEELVRDYRLTLDYQEDVEMFDLLFEKLSEKGLEPNLVNVISILDSDPSIAEKNSHLTLRYKTDQKLIDKLNRVTKIEVNS